MEKIPGEYVTGVSSVTRRALGVIGSVYRQNTYYETRYVRLRVQHAIILPLREAI